MRETWVDPWVGKIPWRRKWQPTPVFLPGESHGQRSLAGYSPRGRKELDTTERLHTQEGKGNLYQLETMFSALSSTFTIYQAESHTRDHKHRNAAFSWILISLQHIHKDFYLELKNIYLQYLNIQREKKCQKFFYMALAYTIFTNALYSIKFQDIFQYIFFICNLDDTHYQGFSDTSVGNESPCSAGDLVQIPGLGRSTGEGIGYPPHYSWASLISYPPRYSWASLSLSW